MRGVEKVFEDIDELRSRLARLDSLGYIDHDFFEKIQPQVLDLLREVGDYVGSSKVSASPVSEEAN